MSHSDEEEYKSGDDTNDDQESDSSSDSRPVVEFSDDPSISSAALCIELQLFQNTNTSQKQNQSSPSPPPLVFRPQYTHQCFPGESIRGYQPLADVLDNVNGNNNDTNKKRAVTIRHKSYASHDAANQELSIVVQLAPSGRACNVEMNIRKKRILRSRRHPRTRNTKRQRINDSMEQEESSKNTAVNVDEALKEALSSSEFEEEDDNDEDDESDFEDNDNSDEEKTGNALDPEGSTRHSRMSRTEIIQSLQKGLPDIVQHSVQNDYLKTPIGTVIHTYSRGNDEFCITLAKGRDEATASYHNSVQRIALLFIENADDVDVASEEDGGYWKILYLFQKHASNKFFLAGYITLFHFTAPFRKPLPGTIVRICQAVVLPPFQRSGHGREMLHKVHDLAQGRFDEDTTTSSSKSSIGKYGEAIVEINVEDPAPGFVALRNLVDFERYRMSKKDWFQDIACRDSRQDTYFAPLSEGTARELSKVSKLTVQQMQIVYEIDRLRGLPSNAAAEEKEVDDDNDLLGKKYRLMVKKRLNRDSREELGVCRNKDEMKKELDRMYNEQKAMYDMILRKARSPNQSS